MERFRHPSMRLKSVRIYGFKTFADRTDFDVHGGIVAVVGPNGCGKSNLVDAILWGLGEGTPRQLRAQTSQDVIFAGSSRRKPVGYAEVTLLFDNEDGALPIDSAEVSITRRLDRSGDSEYRINRVPCRLRDILELLADSGLGRAGYAIVGQKEIDQALAASPEDRRAWVDEAAGVQRYRARKIESTRRLTQAHSHLERVNDILAEIEHQREPLREEAEVALRYRTIQTSLREVETDLLVVEVAKANRELCQLATRLADAQKLIASEAKLADASESEAEALAAKIRDLERRAEAARTQHQGAALAAERAESAVRLGEQKLQALEALEHNLGDDIEGASRTADIGAELEVLRREADAEAQALVELTKVSAGAGAEATRLATALQDAERKLAEARELHGRQLRQEAEAAHSAERRKAIKRELKGIDATLPDLEKGVTDAEADHLAHVARVTLYEAEAAGISERLASSHEADRKDDQERRRLLAEQSSLEGRKQGLEMTIEAHEGLTQGSRAVLEAVKQGLLDGPYLPVGEAITVEQEFALAIETALGNASNDLICDSPDYARRAIALLKEHRLGRATFQPIPLMRPPVVTEELKKVLGQLGVVGRASELVECRAAHRPVIEAVLGRVIVVETLDDALRLAGTRDWARMVTLEGEVLQSAGAVTGGLGAKQAYGLVQRRSDLAQIEKGLKDLGRQVNGIDSRIAKRGEARRSEEVALAKVIESRREAEGEAREAREWLAQLREELVATERSKSKLIHEEAQLAGGAADALASVNLPALEEARDLILKQVAGRTADAESAEARLREADARAAQAKLRVEVCEKRLAASEEQDRLRSKKIANLGPEKGRASLEIASADKEREAAMASREESATLLDRLANEREATQLALEARRASERQARHRVQELTEAAHQSELARARLDARRAASAQRLLEEYGLTEDDAQRRADGTTVPADASSLVGRLRRELRGMGEVNLGAVEAYERLTSRCTELTEQKRDVEEGISEILESIRELDRLTRDRFLNTFEAVRESFTELFTRMFEGGEGRIELTRPDDLLESGIEIDVTLPGKKRQRLELLSGGERSLCATAFLFALLKVKPSPLVVLDEVDAPLDGRNVERYVQLLRDFSDQVQFIVITHNPATIEAAPVWLGVTMQEPGVSTLVPARMPERALVVDRRDPRVLVVENN